MTEERPKKVTIDPTYSSNPLILRNFTKLVEELKKNDINEEIIGSLTEAKLASLILNFQTTMEQLCGKDSSKPRPITKIPLSYLQDYSVNGFLHALLLLLCKEAAKSSTAIVDLFSDNNKSIQLLEIIEKELTKQGHLKRPKVFLNNVPVGKLNLLSRIVQDHGGMIVPSEDAATHVIDWNEEVDSTPDSSEDYIRILEVKGPTEAVTLPSGERMDASGGCALVHWWYYPDSYNEWIPDTEISVSDSPDLTSLTSPSRDKWYVCCRFILDCEVFNEWGNPVDYENDNNEALGAEEVALEQLSAAAGASDVVMSESPRERSSSKKARGRKRFSQLATGIDAKERMQTARDVPIVGALTGAEKLMPDAIPPSLQPGTASQVVEIAQAGNTDHKLITVGEVGTKRNASDAQLDSTDNTNTTGSAVVSTLNGTEPSWFSQNSISDFEIQMLGTTCTADAGDYLKVRNGIIALCAQSPLQYITATECRRKLPGDVSKILQVHEFLNIFALINSRARREARPDAPASLLVASVDAVTASTSGTTTQSSTATTWSSQEDTQLAALVSKHCTKLNGAVEVDWTVVCNELQQQQSADSTVRTPADCAARFVEQSSSISTANGKTTSVTHQGNSDIAEQVRMLTQTVKSLSADTATAVSYVVHESVNKKLDHNSKTLNILSHEYIRTKLEVLEEKVTLLQDVEALCEVERIRLAADKRDLQVLRAQLALAQQNLLPTEVPSSSVL